MIFFFFLRFVSCDVIEDVLCDSRSDCSRKVRGEIVERSKKLSSRTNRLVDENTERFFIDLCHEKEENRLSHEWLHNSHISML